MAAAVILEFDPAVHLKVRHNDQLYVVVLNDYDFFKLPPHAEVVIHLFSRSKIIFHPEKGVQSLYTVKKRELLIVESHVED